MKYLVAELTGGELDAAVAACGEWEAAHRYYPTMTLDPTFSGWYLTECSGEMVCYLKPRNPMRQDPQPFPVSSDWAFGGPIIERERISLHFEYDPSHPPIWHALTRAPRLINASAGTGPTPLIAAMRAFVTSKSGETVDLP